MNLYSKNATLFYGIDMAEKITSKQKEAEHKAIENKEPAILEYKGPEPEGPRHKKREFDK
ncbi:MAG TPA: hypothetical protein VIO58_12590 [Candidatus Methanoperedens sp.]